MFEKLVKSLFGYCNKDLQFKRPPRLFIKQDSENSKNPLGKTAYYQPNEQSITVYSTGRHCKDMLRSIAHELVHHHQNERGDFDNCGGTEPGYAQNDEHLRNMEKEAYLKGNMLFRDWEDSCKKQMQMEDNNKMKLSELKKIIKETIKDIVSEVGAVHRRQGPRASFIGDPDSGTPKNAYDMSPRDTSRVPGEKSPEYIARQDAAKKQCEKDNPGATYREILNCMKQKMDPKLRESEEETLDEGGCASHGKREDKKSKKKCPHCDGDAPESECINKPQKKKEKTDEGKAHGKCKNGCQCEPIKEGEEPEVDSATIEEIDEPETDNLEEGGCGKSGKREDKKSKVMTPEKEKALKENYMGEKRRRLFEKLTKKWTK